MNEVAAREFVENVVRAISKTSQQAALGIGDAAKVREAAGNTKTCAVRLLTTLLCVKGVGQSTTTLLADAKYIDEQLGNGADETQEALKRITASR